MPKTEIISGTCTYNGEELPIYIPLVNGMPVLEKGSYILQESQNPIAICPICNAAEHLMAKCTRCRNGFIKGVSQDNKYIAQYFINAYLKSKKI